MEQNFEKIYTAGEPIPSETSGKANQPPKAYGSSSFGNHNSGYYANNAKKYRYANYAKRYLNQPTPDGGTFHSYYYSNNSSTSHGYNGNGGRRFYKWRGRGKGNGKKDLSSFQYKK